MEEPKSGSLGLTSYRMLFIQEDGVYDGEGNKLEEYKKPTYPSKEYDIWSEGYQVTGNESGAMFLGKETGRNFQDACMKHFLRSELEQREKYTESDYYDTKRWDYNPNSNTFWGCRLFETEEEARKSFG